MTLINKIIANEILIRTKNNTKRDEQHQYTLDGEEIINTMSQYELLEAISNALIEIQ